MTRLRIHGLKRWKKALDPARMSKNLRIEMRRATVLNGKQGERIVRKSIQSGNFAANAPLTGAIKGSGKPLVDQGDLFQSVTSKVEDDFTVFIGILRSSKNFDTAVAVHDGFEAPVTSAMRGLFWMLWQASIGAIGPDRLTGRAADLWQRMPGGWKPLHPSTSVITTPERPFIKGLFTNFSRTAGGASLKTIATKNWRQAFERAMRAQAKG